MTLTRIPRQVEQYVIASENSKWRRHTSIPKQTASSSTVTSPR